LPNGFLSKNSHIYAFIVIKNQHENSSTFRFHEGDNFCNNESFPLPFFASLEELEKNVVVSTLIQTTLIFLARRVEEQN
jgi:hypothetical protein